MNKYVYIIIEYENIYGLQDIYIHYECIYLYTINHNYIYTHIYRCCVIYHDVDVPSSVNYFDEW